MASRTLPRAVFTVLLADETVQTKHSVAVTRETLTQFAELHLASEDRLAMEATTNTWAVAEIFPARVRSGK